jgi:hypothetical protein
MAELALAGDVQAAKLVLAYAIGKPAAAADPDRLDVEEWNHFKEAAPLLGEAESLLTLDPTVLLESVRWGRQARTWDYTDMMTTALRAPEQSLPSLLGRAGRGPQGSGPTGAAAALSRPLLQKSPKVLKSSTPPARSANNLSTRAIRAGAARWLGTAWADTSALWEGVEMSGKSLARRGLFQNRLSELRSAVLAQPTNRRSAASCLGLCW